MRWALILSTMRWSLILSTFIAAQSALSFAAVIPSSDQLQRRGPAGAKVASKTYRKNSEGHPYAYKFDKTGGGVTRERLEPSERLPHNQKMLKIPKMDADHVFEHQMLNGHLHSKGLKWKRLKPVLKKKVRAIINGPGNMAPVPAGINRGKGQVVKHGMKGKAIAPKKDRDEYTKVGYGTARNTAKQLDQAFWKAGYRQVEFQYALRKMMNAAKIMKSNDPSPAFSRATSSRASSPGPNAGSIKGTPKRPARVYPVVKPSPLKGPARNSGTKGTPKRPARVNRVVKPIAAKPLIKHVPFHRTPRKTMNNAKIMKPDDPSPASSRAASSRASSPGPNAGSTKGTPKRSARVFPVGKPSPQKATARKSGRIAAMPPKNYKY